MSYEDDMAEAKKAIENVKVEWIRQALEKGFTEQQTEFLYATCRNSILNNAFPCMF
jgi:hypothetical protein